MRWRFIHATLLCLISHLFTATLSVPSMWDLFDYVHAGGDQGDRSYQIIDNENGNGPRELQNAGQFGWAVAQVGDLDGDGVADLASSAIGESCWRNSTEEGQVDPNVPPNATTVCGKQYNNCTGNTFCDYQEVDYGTCKDCSDFKTAEYCVASFTSGLNPYGVFACQCDCFGECTTELPAGQLLPRCGAVYVLLMQENATVKRSVRITLGVNGGPEYLRANDNFGHGVASAGDLNGDGVLDLAVGAPGTYTGGSLYILFMNKNGSSTDFSLIRGAENGNGPPVHFQGRFASSVNNIGDLDGDGLDELAVTAADHASGDEKVWILYLFRNGTCRTYIELVVRDATGLPTPRNLYSGFGVSVIRVQDLNGDGITDLAIGAKWYTDPKGAPMSGAVFLCMMNSTGVMLDHKLITDVSPDDELIMPMAEGENCGASLASVRDINLDDMDPRYPTRTIFPAVPSVDDLVVGCPQSDLSGLSGRAMLWYMDQPGGSTSGQLWGGRKSYSLLPLYPGYTEYAPPLRAQEGYGSSMTSINDADGNGIEDFIVGAPGGNGEFPGTGRLFVIFLHRQKYVKKKFDYVYYWLVRTLPPGFLLCMCCLCTIAFCKYFRRKPDEVEIAIKKAGVETGLQRKRVKKSKIKVEAIYSDDYD